MAHDVDNYLLMYQSAQDYLKLSRIHSAYLGGLRWWGQDDALVDADNRTFAFSEATAEFIEGFASHGRVVAFGYLLHWMDLLQNRRGLAVTAIKRLRVTFDEAGNNWRFAGAFAATLCEDVPEVPEPPDLGAVGKRLRNRAFPIRWFTSQFHESLYPPEHPPIAPAEFETEVIRKLESYSETDLRSWLRTGRGPIRQAERLAEAPPLPRSLARVLATLMQRPRLAGAETYVTQLVGALTLPPRRFVPQELPVGGYTDIVTRGQVEHLLPTQFALDELEFLRRFAEKELLYFRREEPPAQNRQELVVLVDQGVRTWGDVRLVLSAAALAFGKQAVARKTPFFLATTSNHGRVVEPTQEDEETLGQMIESSDLSLNPGLALEQTLETPSEAMRDVVLLTHPRNLREADVQSAGRRLGPRDRLFAVALDAHGQVEVSEVRRGTPVKVRQFHVDFAPSQPKPARHRPRTGHGSLWTGDVETIPYPFRLGTEPHLTHFDFDYAGNWLLTASGQGTLHLWHLDGSGQEMLPRPCRIEVLANVLGVLGVKGGFVVSYQDHARLAVAHYDIVRRRVARLDLEACKPEHRTLRYVHEHHSVTIGFGGDEGDYLIELDTGTVYTRDMELAGLVKLNDGAAQPEALHARERALDSWCQGFGSFRLHQNRFLPHVESESWITATPGSPPVCQFDSRRGVLMFHGEFPWGPFIPLSDGKACFKQAIVRDVQLAGRTLAVRAKRQDIGESVTLVHCPNAGQTQGAVLGEYPILREKHKISRHLLSFDGSRIALLRSDHRVEVESVQDRGLPSICTRVGGYTREMLLYVGTNCLLLNLGTSRQYWHLFDWNDGKLEHYYQRTPFRLEPVTPASPIKGQRAPYSAAGTSDWPACCAEDRGRYVACVKRGLWFVLDRFGQVAVLNESEQVVAMFIVFRDRVAAWLPDGTCFGTLMLSLHSATKDAAEKIAHVLTSRDR